MRCNIGRVPPITSGVCFHILKVNYLLFNERFLLRLNIKRKYLHSLIDRARPHGYRRTHFVH